MKRKITFLTVMFFCLVAVAQEESEEDKISAGLALLQTNFLV